MKCLSRAVLIAGGVCLAATVSSYAQSIEIGGTLGMGARGSEGSLVRGEARGLASVYSSVVWADRVEAMLRMAWLDLPQEIGASTYYTGCEPDPASGRCRPTGSFRIISQRTAPRTFVAAQVMYHFRRSSRVRPFVGGGLGIIRDTERTVCEVAGCEARLPGLPLGERSATYSDPTAAGGMSMLIEDHFVLRGYVQVHRLFGEGLSLLETSASVGYRF